MSQNCIGSLSYIIPVLSLLVWSGVVSGSSPPQSDKYHVPNAPWIAEVGNSECPSAKPDISISLLQTRHSMGNVRLDSKDKKKDGGPVKVWNKIPLSNLSWHYAPGHGDAWGEWSILGQSLEGGFHGPGTKHPACALRADSYNSKQIPANCRSDNFPVGQKFCVAGTTYEVIKSWNSGGGSTVNHEPKPGRETIPKGTEITFGSCGFQTKGSSAAPGSDSEYRPGTLEECGRTNNVKKMKEKSPDLRYCRFLSEADGGKSVCENSFRRGEGKKGLTRLCYWDAKANKCDGGERVICLKTK